MVTTRLTIRCMILPILCVGFITTASVLQAQSPDLPFYEDHTALMMVKSADGTESPVRSVADWQVRRSHIISGFEKVAGPMPGGERRVLLQVERGEIIDESSYTRQHVTYAVEPGDRATAWLLIPKGIKATDRRVGVVAIHQTTAIGKDEPANVGGLKNLHYGQELAERGCVVICPDYHRFGERKVDPYKTGWQSATMKGIWDHMRAVDLLASLPEVDPEKIAAIGHSLGGHNSLFLALYDTRVKVVVSSCGYNAFPYYYGGKITGWSHEGYMPRLRTEYDLDLKRIPFDWPELLAAVAPRAVFTNAPLNDSNFEVEGVRVCEKAARPVFELFNASDHLVFVYPEAAHDFPEPQRKQAYDFLLKQLGK